MINILKGLNSEAMVTAWKVDVNLNQDKNVVKIFLSGYRENMTYKAIVVRRSLFTLIQNCELFSEQVRLPKAGV